jgi:hypothetical protein
MKVIVEGATSDTVPVVSRVPDEASDVSLCPLRM